MGIEILVRDRFELPSYNTMLREALAQRAAVNNGIFTSVLDKLGDDERKFLDSLLVSDEETRVSPWNELKADSPKPTLYCLRDLIQRHARLAVLAQHNDLLKNIAYTKLDQLSIEAQSLNAAVMIEVAPAKRYVLALALEISEGLDINVLYCQLFNNGLVGQMVYKKSLAHINKYIITEITGGRNDTGKFF